MLNGKLSRRHVDLLRKTDNIRVFAQMQRDQKDFISFARNLEWNSFKQAVTYWMLVHDQDGPQPEDHEAKNSCIIRKLADGRIKIALNLDPLSGETVAHQIETEAGRLFDDDQQDSSIVRTVSQRRSAAFTNLVERGAGRSETNAKPLMHIVMSLKVLEHTLAQMAKPVEERDFVSVLDPNDIDGRCELADGTVSNFVRTSLFAPGGKNAPPLSEKTLTGSEARVATMSANADVGRKCRRVTGCDAITEWLRADHHKPFSKTQQTTLADLRNICDPDNKTKGAGPPLAERHAPTMPEHKPAWEEQ